MKRKKAKCETIEIKHLNNTTAVTMEKNAGKYYPAADPSSNPNQTDVTEKPTHGIELERELPPLKKKARKKTPFQDVCMALCRFPESFENMETAAILLLLILLSQIAYLLVGLLPALPILLLNYADPCGITSVLEVLLRAIQGPEKWYGCDWSLRRPWAVRPRLAPGGAGPSASIMDYIGGKYAELGESRYLAGKKREFCFPFVNSAFALMSGLPASVGKSLILLSPLALPITFERSKKIGDRSILELTGETFGAYDMDGIENLKKHEATAYLEVTMFLDWFYSRKKHIKRWKNEIDLFRPSIRRGRFTQLKSDLKTEYLCAALSLFQQFLSYASEETEWLTPEEAGEILLQYWRLVLPESAPKADDEQEEPETLNYTQPDVFYRFLTEWFLPTYRGQVLQAAKGTQGTMGLIRSLDGTDFFITPRRSFLEAYAQWLGNHDSPAFDLFAPRADAAVQRTLFEAGVPLKHETNNPSTWRFAFYGKAGSSINCLALPLTALPDEVRKGFGILFGGNDAPVPGSNRFEALTNGEKGANLP